MNSQESKAAGSTKENLKEVIGVLEKENNEFKEPESFPGRDEMEIPLQKVDKDLNETRREWDKVRQELKRLKQHLLEKESEESEKMDEDIANGLKNSARAMDI